MKFFKKKVIHRGDNMEYLVRYNLFECRYFSIKIHHILLSDDDCQHDHPWKFISFILWGGYTEYRTIPLPDGFTIKYINETADFYAKAGNLHVSQKYGIGSIIKREAADIHRLELTKPAWTLVMTFKKTREWGFWTPRGWVQWFKYRSTGSHCE